LVYRNTAIAHAGGAGIVTATHGARRPHVRALDLSSLASVPVPARRFLRAVRATSTPWWATPPRPCRPGVIGHGFEPVLATKCWSGGTCWPDCWFSRGAGRRPRIVASAPWPRWTGRPPRSGLAIPLKH